jgi:hypothetical protein
MTTRQMLQAIEIGYVKSKAMDHGVTLCQFAAGIHAALTEMARSSGFVWAIVLRAAAGRVSQWMEESQCP